jgi:hypothetical protein
MATPLEHTQNQQRETCGSCGDVPQFMSEYAINLIVVKEVEQPGSDGDGGLVPVQPSSKRVHLVGRNYIPVCLDVVF